MSYALMMTMKVPRSAMRHAFLTFGTAHCFGLPFRGVCTKKAVCALGGDGLCEVNDGRWVSICCFATRPLSSFIGNIISRFNQNITLVYNLRAVSSIY